MKYCFITLCALLLFDHSACAFDKNQVCFYQASSKSINCDCEARKGRLDAFARYFCKNSEGIWQSFDDKQKSWQKLTTEPVCMVHSLRGNVRCPCYHDKTQNICACKDNKGEWNIFEDKSNQWQMVQPDNYKCRQNKPFSEVIRGQDIITPPTKKEISK